MLRCVPQRIQRDAVPPHLKPKKMLAIPGIKGYTVNVTDLGGYYFMKKTLHKLSMILTLALGACLLLSGCAATGDASAAGGGTSVT